MLEAAWVELMIKGTEGRAEGEINSMAGDKEGGQELRWELGVQRKDTWENTAEVEMEEKKIPKGRKQIKMTEFQSEKRGGGWSF